MKIKDGFILRNIADEWVVVPVGERALRMQGALILSDVAAFLWKKLQTSIPYETILSALLDQYDIDPSTAAEDLNTFLLKLQEIDALDEEISDREGA